MLSSPTSRCNDIPDSCEDLAQHLAQGITEKNVSKHAQILKRHAEHPRIAPAGHPMLDIFVKDTCFSLLLWVCHWGGVDDQHSVATHKMGLPARLGTRLRAVELT